MTTRTALCRLGRRRRVAPLLNRAVEHLSVGGAGRVLLACTELPLTAVPPETACIDASEALARSCLAW